MLRAFLLGVMSLAIVSCANQLESHLPDATGIDLSPKGSTPVKNRQGNPKGTAAGAGSYELFNGTAVDGGSRGDLSSGAPGVEQTDDKFSINVDGADIGDVSKLVLGDTLGFNYIVDPRVQGTVTLSSIRPMTSHEVLSAFEAALRLSGAALIRQGGVYKVVPLQEVLEGEMGTAEYAQKGGTSAPGYGVTVIPLRFISPANLVELLDSFIARSGSVRASVVGNMLLVRGSGEERQQITDVVMSFDVDWMKQQTAGIATLANAKPAEIVSKVNAIFANDGAFSGSNALKVIPLERLNGVVVIANSREKVRRALAWIGRLDQQSDTETQFYVYNVQNGSAVNLAKILNATFLEKSGEDTSATQVDPNQMATTVDTSNQNGDPNNPAPDAGGQDQSGGQTADGKTDKPGGGDTTATTTPPSTDIPKPDLASNTRITPNPDTNTIVIRATPQVYAKIYATLKQLDKAAVQVLVNATIVEVSLNDTLQYGVQAYFKSANISGGVSNGNNLTIRPNLPGFNLLFGSVVDPRVVIDALNKVTKVRVVSSPSVAVMENEDAVIKVGESVPIAVQQQQNTTVNNNNIINSIQYRDAGVILKVKPRVSANGTVNMSISQELSSVTGSSKLGPTFGQRSVNSRVAVPSAQTVVLGGLISGQETLDKNGVPIVNKIPVIGDLIGHTDNVSKRSELIVFLTPQIIQNGEDAAQVGEELRDKMRLLSGQ